VGKFSGEHPVVPAVGNGAADHLLGIAAVISVGGVDEVDAGLACFRNDPRRSRLIGRPAEHHGAQADRRDFQAAAAELTIFHWVVLLVGYDSLAPLRLRLVIARSKATKQSTLSLWLGLLRCARNDGKG